MANVCKIVKYGLEPEVDPLLDNGISLAEIADKVVSNHPEIVDLQGLSSMAIMRYRDKRNRNKIEDDLEDGNDPVDTFLKEYNEAIRKLMTKNEKWDDRVEQLWQECKDDASIVEKAKIIKEARDNREQSKKEWNALAKYGVRQTSNIYNINLKKEQNTKIMLLNWSKEILDGLCSECKAKSRNKIMKLIEEEN